MIRIGQGFDVHRFVKGRPLMLGGVRVEHEFGLLGHSDADVLLHAISDALLGALALGDIGQHFPDTEDRWRGADSWLLLQEVGSMLRERGAEVQNIDATVICERPKIRPYVTQMQERIAAALELKTEQISIKGTTSEGLGFTGRGEGIAAQAIVLLTDCSE